MTALELISAGGNMQLQNISLLLRDSNLAKSFKCCGHKNGKFHHKIHTMVFIWRVMIVTVLVAALLISNLVSAKDCKSSRDCPRRMVCNGYKKCQVIVSSILLCVRLL